MIAEMIEENHSFIIDHDEKQTIISKLERLMQNQNLEIQDVQFHLESHFLNTNENILNMKVLNKIESNLVNNKKNSENSFKSNIKKNSLGFSAEKKSQNKSASIFHETPKTSTAHIFYQREEKGNILFTYNDGLYNQKLERYKSNYYAKNMIIKTNFLDFPDFLNCSLVSQSQSLQKHYNYLKESFEVFLKQKDKNFEKFEDCTYLPNKKCYSFVRILCDGDGKLNEKSILVDFPELSYKIYLDLTDIENAILFPNQCIAIEGTFIDEGIENKKINAEKIYTEFVEKIEEEELENQYEKSKAKKIKIENNTMIIVAAGPFTLSDSISYSPLNELIKEVKKLMPEYLFLFGPFVDKNNTIVQSGLIEISNQFYSYDMLFQQLMLNISQEIGDGTEIFIIPSTNDMNNLFPIPQEPFFQGKKIAKNIQLVSNPSIIEYDGDISFHLFNSTIIDDLRTQSLFKIPISQNRIDPCLQQLINQRHLTPMHPISQNVDLRKYHEMRIKETPNFVIIPSNIGNGFAKLIGDTLFINPGFVCKNEGSRTYAQIVIYDDSNIKVENRTRVDIINL